MSENILVTGGSGFVGTAIVRALVARGHRVRALARSAASAEKLQGLGADVVAGDLLDAAALAQAVEGVSVVVHAAASLTSGVRYADHARTNIDGTKLLLSTARAAEVRRFIYVSAASIVIDADRPTEGDESLPVQHYRSMPYSATKGVAESLVLAANAPDFTTIALRPPFIWGERAPMVSQIVDAFRARQFAWIGGGEFPYSICHVDNLAAAVALSVERGEGGSAYFVTDDETTSMRSFFTELVEAAGQPAKAPAVPYWLAALLSRVIGVVFGLVRPGKTPPLTIENVRLMGHALRVSSAKATVELGYAPTVSRSVGMDRLRSSI